MPGAASYELLVTYMCRQTKLVPAFVSEDCRCMSQAMSQAHAESTGDQHHAVDQPLPEKVDITQGLWWLTLCTHISVAVCLDAGCH